MNHPIERILFSFLIVSTAILFGPSSHCQASETGLKEILATTDERIEQHRKGDMTLELRLPDGTPLERGSLVEIEQTRHAFLFGCNVFMLNRLRKPDENEAYAERFADLFNFATLPFYWWGYEHPQGQYKDARSEEIMRWCKANSITTKGHPLAWNMYEPNWLPDDTDKVMARQFGYVDRSVRRFQGGIDIWDVVNEATQYDRDNIWEQAPKLTKGIQTMGRGPYLRQAFETARIANPDAVLIINDYSTSSAFEKDVLAELVDERKKPLYDAIGLQSHMHSYSWSARRTWRICERFAKYGKPLHFTEATILSGASKDKTAPSPWPSTSEGEERQAKEVAEFYTVLFSHPSVEAITWWDFSDQGAWQQAPAGLLRADLSTKPAYEALVALIKDMWWTRTEVRAGNEGQLAFRGFYGEYVATMHLNGQRYNAAFTLERGLKSPVRLTLE